MEGATIRDVNAIISRNSERFIIPAANSAEVWTLTPFRREVILRDTDWAPITSLGFAPDDRFAVTGHEDGVVRLWDPTTAELFAVLRGHRAPVVGFSFDEHRTITYSTDGEIRTWRRRSHEPISTIKLVDAVPIYVVPLRDSTGRLVVAALGRKGGVDIVPDESASLAALRWTLDPDSVSTVRDNGLLLFDEKFGREPGHAIDLETGEEVKRRLTVLMPPPEGAPSDGLFLTSADAKMKPTWPIRTFIVGFLKTPNAFSQVFSRDGTLALTSDRSQGALVWNASAPSQLAIRAVALRGHADLLDGSAFSADRRWAVTSDRRGVRLYSLHAHAMLEEACCALSARWSERRLKPARERCRSFGLETCAAHTRNERVATPFTPNASGCADGAREGFRDTTLFPDVAGCAAQWFPSSLSQRPLGDRCGQNLRECPRPSDACDRGWHVCGAGPFGKHEILDQVTAEGCAGAGSGSFVAALGAGSCECSADEDNGAACCGDDCEPRRGSCLWPDSTASIARHPSLARSCARIDLGITWTPVQVDHDIGVMCCRSR